MTEREEAIPAFFDAFVEAFATFDGRVVAQRYLCPYLAFHSSDSSRVFRSKEEIADYFQEVVDGYRARGCESCRYRGLEALAMGNDCALATVTWELLSADRSVVTSWRESYNLCIVDGRYKVFTSIDHA